MTKLVNSQHSRWCIFDTDPAVGNTNNVSFNHHFKERFLNKVNRKYVSILILDELVKIIVWIIRYYSTKDYIFKTTFSPEAKHKCAATAPGVNKKCNNWELFLSQTLHGAA